MGSKGVGEGIERLEVLESDAIGACAAPYNISASRIDAEPI